MVFPAIDDGTIAYHEYTAADTGFVASIAFYQCIAVTLNAIILYIIFTDHTTLRKQRSIILLINVSVADFCVVFFLGSAHTYHLVTGGFTSGMVGCGFMGISAVFWCQI